MIASYMRWVFLAVLATAGFFGTPGQTPAQIPIPTATGQHGSAAGRPGQTITVQVWLAAAPRQGYSPLGGPVTVTVNGSKLGSVPTNRTVLVRGGSIGVGQVSYRIPPSARPGQRLSLSVVYPGRGLYAGSSGSGVITVTK